MLELLIKGNELYDENTNKFITTPDCKLTLEHSLISVAKWEAKWKIPYFQATERTREQDMDYIKCMVIGPVPDDQIIASMGFDDMMQIRGYIEDPMTATVFNEKRKNASKKRIMTAEVIYSRMFANSIPLDCQKWHLNRLLSLIRVCELNNSPPEKMSKKDTAAWNAEQNAIRRAKYNTKG